MKRSSWVGLGAAAVFLVVAAVWFFVRRGNATPPTPETLIAESLDDAENAAQKRNLRGVMEIVSDDFHAGNLNRDRLRLYLMRALNQSRGVNYKMRVTPPRIFPTPQKDENKRLVVSRLSVFYTDSGESIWGGNEPIVFVMQKETRRKWLFFKEPRWRIVGVPNLPALPGSDDGGGSGAGAFGGLL